MKKNSKITKPDKIDKFLLISNLIKMLMTKKTLTKIKSYSIILIAPPD